MMTEEEKILFSRFITDNVYENDITYKFTMKSGDVLIVEYDGDGESEVNPYTGEDDDYYGYIFHIIRIEKYVTDYYLEDSLFEVSKYDFPINIEILNKTKKWLHQTFKIILPVKLEGLICIHSEYDVTNINDERVRILKFNDLESNKYNMERFFDKFAFKYNLLIGYGDYCFLNVNECKLLKRYIEEQNVLDINIYKDIYNIVNEAISLNTGLGFDF